MSEKLRNELIATIRNNTPPGTNTTNFLMDTLNTGRESVYRRLRGEINFTFDEIASISLALGFSVDNIIGVKKRGCTHFDMHLLQEAELTDIYKERLESYAQLFRKMKKCKKSKVRMANNSLPHFFTLFHKTVSKFILYKWIYQTQKKHPQFSLSDFIVEEDLLLAQNTFIREIESLESFSIIIDNNIFKNLVLEISYFHMRKLVSDNELTLLKNELLEMIDKLETTATNGVNNKGAEVMIYLSAIPLDSSYTHYEYDGKEYCHIHAYSISGMDTEDEKVCQIQKEWIESLKKYSILISQSGEMQRFEFFAKQKELVNNMCN